MKGDPLNWKGEYESMVYIYILFCKLYVFLEKQHALINMKHEVSWDGGCIYTHALWPFWLQAGPKST